MANLTRRELYNALSLYGDPARAGVAKPGPKRVNAKPEQGVVVAVLAMLRVHPRVAWAAKINSGAYKTPDGRFIRFGFVGCPDILGQMRDGRILMLEAKSATGRLTEDQEAMLAKVKANRGLAGVVRSVEDAQRIVGIVTKDQHYEQAKHAFLLKYPHATPKEYEAFILNLVKRLGL